MFFKRNRIFRIIKKIDVSKQAVSSWSKRGVIPENRVEELVEILGVPAEILSREIDKNKIEEEIHRFIKNV
ncbi:MULTISPECIES: hypothetical protein [Clostridia]|uniref:Uncharacterized protein n=2 Tax=Clostridia TaxID=186801 RepID=A0A8I0A7N3_9CLOT|nr:MULTISPECIES: hypothetical protein [Clostridia]MBC5641084.1 hypothetical protein [Clostridium lentum]MBC5653730.1 hypothetical protein [Blautia lenta]